MKKRGFTLVELLIVIALIGILSVAVLSTINPIEQANKANDSAKKNDSSEVLSAIERYYATQYQYPWVAQNTGGTLTNDSEVGYDVSEIDVGICDADCDTDGILITSDELKAAFRKKSFLTATLDVDKVYLYKAASSSSIYVCFIPKSRAFRTWSTSNPLWQLDFTGGVPSAMTQGTSADDCPVLGDTGWDSIDTACFLCVP